MIAELKGAERHPSFALCSRHGAPFRVVVGVHTVVGTYAVERRSLRTYVLRSDDDRSRSLLRTSTHPESMCETLYYLAKVFSGI